MRIFALMLFASVFGFLALGGTFAADAPPNCARYLTFPWRAPCATAIDGDWYLTPGVVSSVAGRPFFGKPPRFNAGTAPVTGTTDPTAIYMSGAAPEPKVGGREGYYLRSPEGVFLEHGGLERRIPLEQWRGKRLRLTLRLKQEGDARAYASVQIAKSNDTAIRTASHRNRAGDGAWQTHSFVLDVPDDATELAIDAGLTGRGTIWLDGFTLQSVNRDIPLTWTTRVGEFYQRVTPFYDFPNPDSIAKKLIPVPGPLRKEEG